MAKENELQTLTSVTGSTQVRILDGNISKRTPLSNIAAALKTDKIPQLITDVDAAEASIGSLSTSLNATNQEIADLKLADNGFSSSLQITNGLISGLDTRVVRLESAGPFGGTFRTPASSSDTGVVGEFCYDADYLYLCTAVNTWKRVALVGGTW